MLASAPDPVFVMSAEGFKLATYLFAPRVERHIASTVLLVHGFASGAEANWVATGWVRDLTKAGHQVLAIDQRGHGASDKPHAASDYSMEALVADVLAVLDTYLLDEVSFIGYSLGARVGWHASVDLPNRITRSVLGGIPDGDPLTRFRVDEARAHIDSGAPVADKLTRAYLSMAEKIAGNDLSALVALVEGMRGGLQPDPANAPQIPMLFATGSEDSILDKSRALAAATPRAQFFEIPERNHFNAPTSRDFRDAAVTFLGVDEAPAKVTRRV